MRLVKLIGLVCAVAALCFSPHLGNAQVDAIIVLEAYGGDVALYESPSFGSAMLQIIPQHSRFIWRGERTDAEGRQWFYVKTFVAVGWITPDDGVLTFADPTEISRYMDVGASLPSTRRPTTCRALRAARILPARSLSVRMWK